MDELLPNRIARRIDTSGSCWQWTGQISKHGYAKINYLGGQRPAHRIVYELLVGPVPDALHLDHLCRNRACVNPDHLEPVTPTENTLRGSGSPARNARKTHCLNGHVFDETNTYMWRGKRHCRACRVEVRRRSDARKKGTAS